MHVSDRRFASVLGAPFRKRRRALGSRLRASCDRAGPSPGYPSRIENDKAVPTSSTLAQVALDVGLEDMVAEPRPADALSRAEGRPPFSIPGSAIVDEAVGADRPGSELISDILHVRPGDGSKTVSHAGEEIVAGLDGPTGQTLGGQAMAMRPGDCRHCSGALPHGWANRTDRPARIPWTGRLDTLHRNGPPIVPARAPANANRARPATGETA